MGEDFAEFRSSRDRSRMAKLGEPGLQHSGIVGGLVERREEVQERIPENRNEVRCHLAVMVASRRRCVRISPMPSQLLDRLRRFFDQGVVPAGANPTHPLDQVMARQNANRGADTLGNPPAHQDPTKPNRPGVNVTQHWAPRPWGSKMVKNTVPALGANNVSGVNTIAIHETSGYPAYSSAQNMANSFLCLSDETVWIEATAAVPPVLASPGPPPVAAKPGKPAVPAHWSTNQGSRGIGPQYYVDGNGTVFALVGEHDLSDEPYITWHSGGINGTSIGIENGDVGDANIRPSNTA